MAWQEDCSSIQEVVGEAAWEEAEVAPLELQTCILRNQNRPNLHPPALDYTRHNLHRVTVRPNSNDDN